MECAFSWSRCFPTTLARNEINSIWSQVHTGAYRPEPRVRLLGSPDALAGFAPEKKPAIASAFLMSRRKSSENQGSREHLCRRSSPPSLTPTDTGPLSRIPLSLFDLYRTWRRVHHGPLEFVSAGGCRFLLGLEQGSSSSFVSKLLRYSQIAAPVRRAVSLESALERHRTC